MKARFEIDGELSRNLMINKYCLHVDELRKVVVPEQ